MGSAVVAELPDAVAATADAHRRHAIHLPPIRSLIRRGGVHVVEATLVPAALFYPILWLAGLRPAVIAALAWSYLAIAARLVRRERVPGMLMLGAGLLTIRTVVSLVTGSTFVYILQPTLGTIAVGIVFLVSLPFGRPLASRLADDFCPLPAHLLERTAIRRIFLRITLLWALVNILSGVVTLWLLLTSSIGAALFARTIGSWALIGAGVWLSYFWFRRSLRGEGITLHWGPAAATG